MRFRGQLKNSSNAPPLVFDRPIRGEADARFSGMKYPVDPAIEKGASSFGVRSWLSRCLVVGCALMAAGCATQPVPSGSHFVVSARAAQFYKNGPAEDYNTGQPYTFDTSLLNQETGPDFELPKGARLTMLKREFGYSRVVTDNGVVGYVSNDQVAPAPAMAATTRETRQVTQNGTPVRGRFRNENPRSRRIEAPSLDLNDVPLPQP